MKKLPNKSLEPTAPLLSHGLLFFGVNNLGARQAARQSRGFHPAQRLAAQRCVLQINATFSACQLFRANTERRSGGNNISVLIMKARQEF